MPPRNRNRGGGGGGGGGIKIVDFVFDGSRSDGQIEFRAIEGTRNRIGVVAELYLGTATLRFAARLLDASSPPAPALPVPMQIVTGNNGVGQKGINLSAFDKKYTRLTLAPPPISAAPAPGGTTPTVVTFEPVTLDLPSDEQIPAVAVSKPKAKFVVDVEGDVIYAKKFFAVIPLETLNEQGLPDTRKIEFTVTEGDPVKLTDARAKSVIAKKTQDFEVEVKGSLRLGVDFTGQFDVTVELYDRLSKTRKKVKLVYRQ